MTSSVQARRALAAAVLLAFATEASAERLDLWHRIKADPRMAHPEALSLTQKKALARDYGVANLLPSTNGTLVPVTNCNDAGPGSLRDAVASAASGDTVDASALTCGTITLTTGQMSTIAQYLTIQGPGPDALTITANHASRILLHAGTGVLTVYGMTVREGRLSTYGTAPARGGCIFSTGKVTLGSLVNRTRQQGVVVEDCSVESHAENVTAFGGGVFAIRGVGLSASVVSGNVASSPLSGGSFGGGVAVVSTPYGFAYGTFLSKYSEIRGNVAGAVGGGLYVRATTAGLLGTTFAGNNAGASSGGGGAFILLDDGDAVIQNTTVSGNRSATGRAALTVFGGTITVAGATITGNQTQTTSGSNFVGGAEFHGSSIDLESSIFSGNLLSGAPSDLLTVSPSNTIVGANNLVGAAVGIVPPNGLITTNNPGLGPLINNGGFTRTHAVLAASPAIDTGNNSQNIPLDQRGPGFPRVIGAAADIGAFERDPNAIFRGGFD
ncbi:MAG: choice-of-anchor Q domain-containing protein [Dokdonella sp.]|uniref:choice-of-anchor Q domain-containing protein n=1 Tax=Dokdonella sp. TaxID=2291710 RepID=UPI0032664EF6